MRLVLPFPLSWFFSFASFSDWFCFLWKTPTGAVVSSCNTVDSWASAAFWCLRLQWADCSARACQSKRYARNHTIRCLCSSCTLSNHPREKEGRGILSPLAPILQFLSIANFARFFRPRRSNACQGHMFEGLTDEQKQSIVTDLSEIDAKLPGGGLGAYLQRARGRRKNPPIETIFVGPTSMVAKEYEDHWHSMTHDTW